MKLFTKKVEEPPKYDDFGFVRCNSVCGSTRGLLEESDEESEAEDAEWPFGKNNKWDKRLDKFKKKKKVEFE